MRILCPILMLIFITTGCGGSDRVDVYPVCGAVTLEGKPMAGGGSIAFLPIEQQKGKAAGGTIESDGKFMMSTYGDGDGSMAGKFRVVITQSVWDEQENTGDSDSTPNGQINQPVKKVDDEQIIPAIYSHPQNSPLTIEVGPDSPSEITFELTKTAKK